MINLVQAQDVNTRKKHFNITDNVALSGYDPITYFVNKPVPGKKEYNYSYKGITYYFINDKSMSVFKSNPEKYEPAYGGWCAYALAKDKPVLMEADPETYKIINGKLHVFLQQFWSKHCKKVGQKRRKVQIFC